MPGTKGKRSQRHTAVVHDHTHGNAAARRLREQDSMRADLRLGDGGGYRNPMHTISSTVEEEAGPSVKQRRPTTSPDDWKEHVDPNTGATYWHSEKRKKSTWTIPDLGEGGTKRSSSPLGVD